MRTLKKKIAETKEKFFQILRAFLSRHRGGKRKAQKIDLGSGGFDQNERTGIPKG